MKVGISGTRSGQEWPRVGGVLECSDEEGAQLCAGGLASPVVDFGEEKAIEPAAEKRGPGRPRKTES